MDKIAAQLVKDGLAPNLSDAKDIVALYMLSLKPNLSEAYCKVISLHARHIKRMVH